MFRKKEEELIPSEFRGTYSGVAYFARTNSREELTRQSLFNNHKPYVFYFHENVDAGRLTIAMASENQLLNAYRQDMCGLPSLVCLDASYRLVLGMSCFAQVCFM